MDLSKIQGKNIVKNLFPTIVCTHLLKIDT